MRKHIFFVGLIVAVTVISIFLCRYRLGKPYLVNEITYAEADRIKVKFNTSDMVNDENDNFSELDMKSIKSARTDKQIEELYAEIPNIAIVRVLEDFQMGASWSRGKVEIVNMIKTSGALKKGDVITLVSEHDFGERIDGKENLYSASMFKNIPQKDAYYFVCLKLPFTQNQLSVMETQGYTPPMDIYYRTGDVYFGMLKLSEQENDFLVEKGKEYSFEQLKNVEFFTCSEEALKQWKISKKAILNYYLGQKYATVR